MRRAHYLVTDPAARLRHETGLSDYLARSVYTSRDAAIRAAWKSKNGARVFRFHTR